MEQSVTELADLVKKLQKDRMADRATDREAFNALKLSLDVNTTVMKELAGWKPSVDAKVDELKGSVDELRVKVDRISQKQEEVGNPAYKTFQDEEIDLTKSAAAHLAASPSGAASEPHGHGEDFYYLGTGHGVVTTIAPTPVTGARNALEITPIPFSLGGYSHVVTSSPVSQVNMHATLPQIVFPEFDGSNPKFWKKKFETYFELYSVPKDFRVKLATMYFVGPTVFWLQLAATPGRSCAI